MSRGAIIIIGVVIAALFGVVFLTSSDQPTENTPETRYDVPAQGGAKTIPAEPQNPAAPPSTTTP